MTTCSDVINSAYRRSGVLGLAVIPNSEQATVGFELLKGMYERMAQGLFGSLVDYYLSSGNYTAKENQRIYKVSGASVITIPPTVTDASTGLTRAPMDGAFIGITDPVTNVPALWIYNTGLGKWQELYTLAITDVAPLSAQFEEPLKFMLAVLLCDENSMEPTRMLASNAGLGKLAIASRYSSARKSTVQVYY